MKKHSKFAIAIVVLGFAGIMAYRLYAPALMESAQKSSSDSRNIKATISIGMDNWIGYYPLCSRDLKKRMRHAGYILQCIDDQADYDSRMQKLKKGSLDFAVATIDSFLLNGYTRDFPGTIISVIDESRGGDAIVAWKNKLASLDAIKQADQFKVALTPDSPSEHLLRSIAVHFDIQTLLNDKDWRISTNGSSQALQILLKGKADAAVLWEPDVTRALENKDIIKLIGTEDTNKLIVDILLVNRQFSTTHPDITKTLLRQYFRSLKFYRDNPERLINDAANDIDLLPAKIKTMLGGVVWMSLNDNAIDWFGVASNISANKDDLIASIESTLDILKQTAAIRKNILPNDDPYRLTNNTFVTGLYQESINNINFSTNSTQPSTSSKQKQFTPLSAEQWGRLREVGTLKIRPIIFMSGKSELTEEGNSQLDRAVRQLKHYPNYRVIVKGHTGTRGDAAANLGLSRQRAAAVVRYLQEAHGIDQNRLHFIGHGANKPLVQKPGESNRAYQYRLPRVELYLVTENI